MKQTFEQIELPYNLRSSDKLQVMKSKVACLRMDTVKLIKNKVWETLPPELKISDSIQIFKDTSKRINAILVTQIKQNICSGFRVLFELFCFLM